MFDCIAVEYKIKVVEMKLDKILTKLNILIIIKMLSKIKITVINNNEKGAEF